MNLALIRKRLRARREERELSQDELAAQMGFKDRQTLSAIENGDRKISADELVKAATALGVALDFFVDPFNLYGEANFSWRQKNVYDSDLKQFEDRAGQVIGLYRWLLAEKGHTARLFSQNLLLDPTSSFEEATDAGDRFAHQIRNTESMATAPALALTTYLQEKLDILLLHVDALPGISGAACRLPQINTILINRNETEGRRHFDIAHELFHILTWDAMPPRYLDTEGPTGGRDKRIEMLADCFAGALLIPTYALLPRIANRGGAEIHGWLNNVASELRVSALALKYRLKNMGAMKPAEIAAIDDSKLKFNGGASATLSSDKLPPLLSQRYLSLVGWGIDDGRISVRRVADILGLPIDALAQAFAAHGLDCPFDI